MESLEVSEQITKTPSAIELANAKSIKFELTELRKTDRGVAVTVVVKNPTNLPDRLADGDCKEMPEIIAPTTPTVAEDASEEQELPEIKYKIKGEDELIINDQHYGSTREHDSLDAPESDLLTVFEIKCSRESDDDDSLDDKDGAIDEDSLHFTRSTVQAKTNRNSIAIKNIDNFSVMQKYLKNTRSNKKIVITVDELDMEGNVVKTEVQQANEFQM